MDRKRLKDCTYTILDNAQAIRMEANGDYPHKSYILEKIEPLEYELRVLKRMCEED